MSRNQRALNVLARNISCLEREMQQTMAGWQLRLQEIKDMQVELLMDPLFPEDTLEATKTASVDAQPEPCTETDR